MDVGFLSPELPKWDEARGDALAVGVWTDVRPLRGAAGLLDWRLCGRLSSWIEGGRLAGAEREQTLFPASRHVPWPAVLVLGLGASPAFTEAIFRDAVRRVVATMKGLGLRRLAIAPPGRDVERVPPKRAMELLLEELRTAPLDEVLVIDTPAAQKEMSEVLRRRRHPASERRSERR